MYTHSCYVFLSDNRVLVSPSCRSIVSSSFKRSSLVERAGHKSGVLPIAIPLVTRYWITVYVRLCYQVTAILSFSFSLFLFFFLFFFFLFHFLSRNWSIIFRRDINSVAWETRRGCGDKCCAIKLDVVKRMWWIVYYGCVAWAREIPAEAATLRNGDN